MDLLHRLPTGGQTFEMKRTFLASEVPIRLRQLGAFDLTGI